MPPDTEKPRVGVARLNPGPCADGERVRVTWGCLSSERPRKLWGAEDTQAVGVRSPPVGREEVVLELGLRKELTGRG